MARFLVMSDVHIEFGDMQLPKAGELGALDGVLLAGDVMPWTNCVRWAERVSIRLDVPVVLIAGNHEFYARNHPNRTIEVTLNAINNIAATTAGRVIFLDNTDTRIAGVQILGCTLWTDFDLFANLGPLYARGVAMHHAGMSMNDYLGAIYTGDPPQLFSPHGARLRHLESCDWLEYTIAMSAEPRIIMTHHAPAWPSVPARFQHDLLSAAYASVLDDLILRSGAKFWLHGHMHDSADYAIGGTRVICNPRGYLGHELNQMFDVTRIIEV